MRRLRPLVLGVALAGCAADTPPAREQAEVAAPPAQPSDRAPSPAAEDGPAATRPPAPSKQAPSRAATAPELRQPRLPMAPGSVRLWYTRLKNGQSDGAWETVVSSTPTDVRATWQRQSISDQYGPKQVDLRRDSAGWRGSFLDVAAGGWGPCAPGWQPVAPLYFPARPSEGLTWSIDSTCDENAGANNTGRIHLTGTNRLDGTTDVTVAGRRYTAWKVHREWASAGSNGYFGRQDVKGDELWVPELNAAVSFDYVDSFSIGQGAVHNVVRADP